MDDGKPDMLRPALAGGLVGGILAIVPPFCCLSWCCCCGCLGFLAAGLIAGGLYARRAAPLHWLPQAGEGAAVGALAGVTAGLLHGAISAGATILGWMSRSLFGPGWVHGARFAHWNCCWGLRDAVHLLSPAGWAIGELSFGIILGPAVGLLGGVLGVLFLRKTPPPQSSRTHSGPPIPLDPGL